ncbi:hypothetical protein CYANOKiyG1_50700 [Okeania sp. KiyG1]|nr:hypothetical protein CYANOKiyG1_50700 [Okeania sp. KiyG1]
MFVAPLASAFHNNLLSRRAASGGAQCSNLSKSLLSQKGQSINLSKNKERKISYLSKSKLRAIASPNNDIIVICSSKIRLSYKLPTDYITTYNIIKLSKRAKKIEIS